MLHRTITIVSIPLLSLLAACSIPEIDKPHLAPGVGTEEGGSNEFGAANEEAPDDNGTAEEPTELPANTCLSIPIEGLFGFRHHCGGDLRFRFAASFGNQGIDRQYSYGFGPQWASASIEDLDTYEAPMVAGCCGGPYDFAGEPFDQRVYYESCKLDAVQQMCAASGQWLTELAKEIPGAAGKLNEAAAILGTQEVQTECALALYEAGELDEQGEPVPERHYRKINETEWFVQAGEASLTIEIELLDILALDYPEPPATCESIFENDSTLLPLLQSMESGDGGPGGVVNPLYSGTLAITDGTEFYKQFDVSNGGMSLRVQDSEATLDTLVIRDATPTSMSFGASQVEIDEWSLSLVGGAAGRVLEDDELMFDKGAAVFSLSFIEYGALRRATATNEEPLTLRRARDGSWLLDGLALELEDASGKWSLHSTSGLLFGPQ